MLQYFTLMLPVFFLLLASSRCTLGSLTEADEAKFLEVPWLDWAQALDAYRSEYREAELLGTNTLENPNRLKFYPENRVTENQIVVAFCLLTPDKINGYRSNSISLKIMELGFMHRRSLLAPTRRLQTPADQLNCWNYVQESVCQPIRDCSKPRYSQWALVSPQLHLNPGYPRGQQLMANCSVKNSAPIGSRFSIELLLIRPPPPGIPGSNALELLMRVSVLPSQEHGRLHWKGEMALLSHHGIGVLCRVNDDWGDRRGQRIASGHFQVMYMCPAYLDNPRVRSEMATMRRNPKQSSYYASPSKIRLLKAEYVVCKVDGHPAPEVKWTVSRPKSVWILNETLFVSSNAKRDESIFATCHATNRQLNLSDAVQVEIQVSAGAGRNFQGVAASVKDCCSEIEKATKLLKQLTSPAALESNDAGASDLFTSVAQLASVFSTKQVAENPDVTMAVNDSNLLAMSVDLLIAAVESADEVPSSSAKIFNGIVGNVCQCLLGIFLNATNWSLDFCRQLSQQEKYFKEFYPRLLSSQDAKQLDSRTGRGNAVYYTIGAAFNAYFKNDSEVFSRLSEFDLVSSTKPYLQCGDTTVSTAALILIAFAVDEKQSDVFLGAKDNIAFLIENLRKALGSPDRSWRGYDVIEVAKCIRRLALNDSNKDLLIELDLLPTVKKLLDSSNDEDVAEGIEILFTLSFSKKFRQKIWKEFREVIGLL
uniref:Ig-like domain-containing protein n=1 Tax=Macrostomum lignano TaxID=282301 RepID=A0A1I8GBE8_9PLAT